MKYDDASWHYGSDDFPNTSPYEFGGTHIALFLKWCFIQGWTGDQHLREESENVKKVIFGEISATDFFFKYCDGKLTNDDFNETGNNFAKQYYGDNGLYLDDYSNCFFDKMYVAPENDHDYSKFSEILERRHRSNKLAKSVWWKFWL